MVNFYGSFWKPMIDRLQELQNDSSNMSTEIFQLTKNIIMQVGNNTRASPFIYLCPDCARLRVWHNQSHINATHILFWQSTPPFSLIWIGKKVGHLRGSDNVWPDASLSTAQGQAGRVDYYNGHSMWKRKQALPWRPLHFTIPGKMLYIWWNQIRGEWGERLSLRDRGYVRSLTEVKSEWRRKVRKCVGRSWELTITFPPTQTHQTLSLAQSYICETCIMSLTMEQTRITQHKRTQYTLKTTLGIGFILADQVAWTAGSKPCAFGAYNVWKCISLLCGHRFIIKQIPALEQGLSNGYFYCQPRFWSANSFATKLFLILSN